VTKPGDRSYKRSWKNLLINKRYQLRFTLFMVGLAALLMLGLGIWVMRVANETTTVSMASVRGEACPKVPSLGNTATDEEEDALPPPSMQLDDSIDERSESGGRGPVGSAGGEGGRPLSIDGSVGDSPAPASAAGPSDPPPPPAPAADDPAEGAKPADAAKPSEVRKPRAAAADDEPRRVQVQIDESTMTLTQAVPPDFADRIVAHWSCELRQAATFDRLERGRQRILWAMIATGVLLVLGLALYGIKMTHRVAGPLFKVSLYLSKMRAGRFDKVYNLRKGDQLVHFYDHFKLAHGGIVQMQRDDIARIAAVISAAEAAGAGQHPAVVELRELLARKEKSIE
jgi:hypothetical protein